MRRWRARSTNSRDLRLLRRRSSLPGPPYAPAIASETRRSPSIADGSIAGRADKAFLWHFDRRWFEPADAIEPIATSIGKLGALVCADGRIPTIARALVDRGARLLVMPTAWVSSGRDPDALENVQADLLARVRAYENGVPFVAANKCGTELGIALYCGKSQIVDATGRTAAIAGEREPEAIDARVEMPAPAPHRAAEYEPETAAPRPLPETPLRIAISMLEGDQIDPARLTWLHARYVIAPNAPERRAELERAVAVATVDDAVAEDPGGVAKLAARRISGHRLGQRRERDLDARPGPGARARGARLRRRSGPRRRTRLRRRSRRSGAVRNVWCVPRGELRPRRAQDGADCGRARHRRNRRPRSRRVARFA